MTVRSARTARQPLATIMTWPALLAAASMLGLTLGLIGEGWHDWAAWFLLGLPVVAAAYCWSRRG